jgi:hypothetical protein
VCIILLAGSVLGFLFAPKMIGVYAKKEEAIARVTEESIQTTTITRSKDGKTVTAHSSQMKSDTKETGTGAMPHNSKLDDNYDAKHAHTAAPSGNYYKSNAQAQAQAEMAMAFPPSPACHGSAAGRIIAKSTAAYARDYESSMSAPPADQRRGSFPSSPVSTSHNCKINKRSSKFGPGRIPSSPRSQARPPITASQAHSGSNSNASNNVGLEPAVTAVGPAGMDDAMRRLLASAAAMGITVPQLQSAVQATSTCTDAGPGSGSGAGSDSPFESTPAAQRVVSPASIAVTTGELMTSADMEADAALSNVV